MAGHRLDDVLAVTVELAAGGVRHLAVRPVNGGGIRGERPVRGVGLLRMLRVAT